MRTHALADSCSSLNSLLSWWPSCQTMTFIHWRPRNYLKILRENWDPEIFILNFFISWKMRLGRIWTQVRWTCSTPRRRWWWCWRPWQQQQWWQWRKRQLRKSPSCKMLHWKKLMAPFFSFLSTGGDFIRFMVFGSQQPKTHWWKIFLIVFS